MSVLSSRALLHNQSTLVRKIVYILAAVVCLLPVCDRGSAAEFSFKVLPEANVVIVSGKNEPSDPQQYAEILPKLAQDRSILVKLSGPGGDASGGIGLGLALRQSNAVTFVTEGSMCVSACAMAWLGGARRSMTRTSHIGFHAPYDMETDDVTLGAYKYMNDYFKAINISPELANIILKHAPGKGFYWLTIQDARDFNIEVTDVDASDTSTTESSTLVVDLNSLVQETYLKHGFQGLLSIIADCYDKMALDPTIIRGFSCYTIDSLSVAKALATPDPAIPEEITLPQMQLRFQRSMLLLGFSRDQWNEVNRSWAGLVNRTADNMAN